MSRLGNNKPFGRSRSPSLPDDIPGLDHDAPAAITCPVCLEIYVEPKLLNCGHTLCLKCVQQLIQNARQSALGYRDAEFMCPECRRPCSAGFHNLLPTNYRLADVINQFKAMKTSPKRIEKPVEPLLKCKGCQEQVKQKQLFICTSCSSSVTTLIEDTSFCGTCCVKNHNGHALISIDQLTTAQERQKVSSNISNKLHELQTRFLGQCSKFNSPQLQQSKTDLLTSIETAFKHISYNSGIGRLGTNHILTKNDLKKVEAVCDKFSNVYDGTMTQLQFLENEYIERLRTLKEGFESQYKNDVFQDVAVDFSFSNVGAPQEEPNLFIYSNSKPSRRRRNPRFRLNGYRDSNRSVTSVTNSAADQSDDDL
uniref:RING-type domain-containing protein n=1 Tax=Panagrolaimus sp. JU765 TaxID=591449 RepID=A0AC34QWK9_9BILA